MAVRERSLFSTRAEYGVRLMIKLARQYGEGPVPLAKLAETELLPLPYLEQLVAPLRRDGLVVSHRGVHGGYELARSPEEITMGAVLRSLEGPIVPMVCAHEDEDHATCLRGEYCSAQVLWTRLRDAVAGVLDSTRLSDLAPDRVFEREVTGGTVRTLPLTVLK
ncbi:MAG: Rrf2 family transcriptional regulator, partial [Chloroflexota bacterium]|nr:Rrf2 family transcriptional regulator [Chloroflexota bacterium]